MRITATRRLLRFGTGTVMMLAALASGCSDDAGEPEAVPAPDRTTFVEGDFDEIPIMRAAAPAQGPSTSDGVTTASYEIDQASPSTVMEFYSTNLPALGWQQVEPPVETSDGVWRGDWIREDRRLQVIASDLSPVEGDATHTQLDLVLLDDAGDVPVATAPVVTTVALAAGHGARS